ncbi:hypothetical protein SAMN05443574_103340 [Haloarcula vallismortis]|uniref:Uncharacterized protein n=1 Tax=Haloarcula vallismortis TaxID=28442 RepID=A0A1H2TQA4_HALVA|nr:hypothetical protein SAMN05443574_103340 [Haloarcula vallismortis]
MPFTMGNHIIIRLQIQSIQLAIPLSLILYNPIALIPRGSSRTNHIMLRSIHIIHIVLCKRFQETPILSRLLEDILISIKCTGLRKIKSTLVLSHISNFSLLFLKLTQHPVNASTPATAAR